MKTTKQQFRNYVNQISIDLVATIDSINSDEVRETVDAVMEHDPVLGNMLKRHNEGLLDIQQYINSRTE